MASRWQITMDFNSAKSKANELDCIAGDLRKIANTDMEGMLIELSGDWKGDNATEYIGKGQTLKEQMQETAISLEKTANTIRTIAQNIYNAEMEAIRIAEERAERAAREAARLAEEQAKKSGGGGGGRRI